MPDETNLARAMLALQREGRTGVLEVRGDAIRALVYVADGVPVFAEHGALGDTLGRLLVRQGMLTHDEYRSVIDRFVAGDKRRFGEIAIELGLLTSDEVKEALAAQVRVKIVRCLEWSQPTWTFDFAADRVKAVPHFPTKVEPLVLVATRQLHPARLDELLASLRGLFPVLEGFADAVAERFQLGAPALAFLRRVDGSRSVDALLDEYERIDAQAILAALNASGELVIRTTPRLTTLGPPPMATPAKPLRPGLVLPRVARSVAARTPASKARAKAVLGRLRTPRSVSAKVPPPDSKTPSFPRMAGLVAEQTFLAAKSHLRANRFAEALPFLHRAVELAPAAREYALSAAWVALRLTMDDAAAAPLRAQVEELANRALRQDPALAVAHYALGYLTRITGDVMRAEVSFRHAQRLDPDTLNAERHVRLVRLAHPTRPAPQRVAAPSPSPSPMPANVAPASSAPPPLPARQPERTSTTPVPEPAPATVADARSVPDATVADVSPAVPSDRAPATEIRAPRPGRAPRAAIGFVLGAGAFALIVLLRSATDGRTSAAPSPSSTPSPSPSPSASPSPTPSATPTPTPTPTPSSSAVSPITPDASVPKTGEILPPESAKQHRVFVDGRVAGEGTLPIVVPCGKHIVKVGSAGKEIAVEVPCGGNVRVP